MSREPQFRKATPRSKTATRGGAWRAAAAKRFTLAAQTASVGQSSRPRVRAACGGQ